MEAAAAELAVKLQGLLEPDQELQRSGLAYLESLKASDAGWRLCVDALLSPTFDGQEHIQFYCLQVVEHYVKTRYPAEAPQTSPELRRLLTGWVDRRCGPTSATPKPFLRNKAAQVFALVFVEDFPARWPAFLLDLLSLQSAGPLAVDHCLRTLLQIDQEIVDREVVHSEPVARRNTAIRDAMRETCVPQLSQWWLHTLRQFAATEPQLACMALETVGKFVSWIDIALVANAEFVSVLVGLLGLVEVREAAADCLHDILRKGMEPAAKLSLVQSLFGVLDQAGVFQLVKTVTDETPAEDIDYLCKLGRLLNCTVSELVLAFHKLGRQGDAALQTALEEGVTSKLPRLLDFLSCDYDDASGSVIDAAREYVQLLKLRRPLPEHSAGAAHVRQLTLVVIRKLQYDPEYDFQSAGEDEACFHEYRRRLKVLYDNLAAVDRELVLRLSQEYICGALQQWQHRPMPEVEAAITLLYMLGEALPPAAAGHFLSDNPAKVSVLHTTLRCMVMADVVSHPHHIVQFQFFETVCRYEKFFTVETALLPQVLTAFLDQRGMHHPKERNRARAVYLFSRFIKCLKVQLEPFTDTILGRIGGLLSLAPSDGARLNRDDQLYLFETVAVLVISSSADYKLKCEQLQLLLQPVVTQVVQLRPLLAAAAADSPQLEVLQKQARHAVAVTARTTKAFSAGTTMKSVGCVELYLEALQVFLGILQDGRQYPLLQSGLVQLMHRLVVCMEEELLAYMPAAVQTLLVAADGRKLQELLPLINQVVAKHKKTVLPFLTEAFMPIAETIFAGLQRPIDETDELQRRERQSLQRAYFLFLASVVSNGLEAVLERQQPQHLTTLLQSVVQAAVQLPDPVAQRWCFAVLRRLSECWGRQGPAQFAALLYEQVVPACLLAPLRPSFDLADAQTVQALQESAACLRAVYEQRGEELVSFLESRYLPSLKVEPQAIQRFCQALRSDPKVFRSYTKLFFREARA